MDNSPICYCIGKLLKRFPILGYPVSFNAQIYASSHLLVFAGLNRITNEYIAGYVAMMEQQRNLENGTLNGLRDMLIAYFSPQTPEQNAIWSDKQAYIGLGTALIAAAELKVDATPMEGFDPKVFDDHRYR